MVGFVWSDVDWVVSLGQSAARQRGKRSRRVRGTSKMPHSFGRSGAGGPGSGREPTPTGSQARTRWPHRVLTADWGAGPVARSAVPAGDGYCGALGTNRTRVRSAGPRPARCRTRLPTDKSTPSCIPNAPRALFEALRRELEVNLPKLDQVRTDSHDAIGVGPARSASSRRSSAGTGTEFVLVDDAGRGHGSGRSVNSVPPAPDFAVHIALAGLSTGQPLIDLGISDERPVC